MSRSRSGSPLSEQGEGLQNDTSIVFDNVNDTENLQEDDNEDIKEPEALVIEQIPGFWRVGRINNIIQRISKTQSIIDGIKNLTMLILLETAPAGTKNGACLVRFNNAHICNLAYEEWKTHSQMDTFQISRVLDNLWKRYRKQKRNLPSQSEDQPLAKRKKLFRNNIKWADKNETYGLSYEFLKGLNIKLPLSSGIYITYLPPGVTEAKIREVFGLAGHIVHATVAHNSAKVLYDHPVEAVQALPECCYKPSIELHRVCTGFEGGEIFSSWFQAISMFNQRKLYSSIIRVKMDIKEGMEMPDGLSEIGPGLGPNGEPMRGVRNHIELAPLKQLMKHDGSGAKFFSTRNTNKPTVNPFVQPETPVFTPIASNSVSVQAPMVAQIPMTPAPIQAQIPVPVQAPNQQSINPFGIPSSMMNPFNMPVLQNLQMLQSFNQQNPASFQQAVDMLLQSKMNMSVASQKSDSSGNTSSEWQTKPNMGMWNDTQSNSPAMDNYNNTFGYQNSDNIGRNYKDSSKYVDSRESRKSSRDEENSSNDKSDMLLFKNLPRTVTLQALKNKMQEVGELKLAEMTGQGRAIVAFVNSRDTECCIKLFDKSKVDGQIVDVRYI